MLSNEICQSARSSYSHLRTEFSFKMPINKARYSFKVIKRQCAIVHLHHAEAEDDNAAAAVEAGDASYAVAASSADELLTTFSYKVQATQFSN